MANWLNRRSALIAITATMVPLERFSALAQSAPGLKPDEARTLAQEAWVFGMPLVYIEKQIDTATHVSKPQGPSPRSTSLPTIASFPTRRTGPSSASTSIRSTRSGASTCRKDRWSCRCRTWASGSGSCSSSTRGTTSLTRRARARSAAKAATSPSSVPNWKGTLPAGLTELRVPTNLVLIGGRTYTANKDDYAAVHALQDQYKLVPLVGMGQAIHPAGQRAAQAGRGRQDAGTEAGAGDVARGLSSTA